MARHKVEISGVNTANIKVLSSEEMTSLFKKMQELQSKLMILTEINFK